MEITRNVQTHSNTRIKFEMDALGIIGTEKRRWDELPSKEDRKAATYCHNGVAIDKFWYPLIMPLSLRSEDCPDLFQGQFSVKDDAGYTYTGHLMGGKDFYRCGLIPEMVLRGLQPGDHVDLYIPFLVDEVVRPDGYKFAPSENQRYFGEVLVHVTIENP